MKKVDSFNLPMYIMSSQELKEAIDRNGCFSIVKLEGLFQSECSRYTAHETESNVRPVMEGLMKEHFGNEILEEVFASYVKKIEEECSFTDSVKTMLLFAVLNRKTIGDGYLGIHGWSLACLPLASLILLRICSKCPEPTIVLFKISFK